MTIAEIDRALESKKRVMLVDRKQAAINIYVLADLIGYSTARIHNSSNKMPAIADIFPSLFSNEEEQERQEQLQVERFKAQLEQFANAHNKKIIKGV